jgi:hypothetical protein
LIKFKTLRRAEMEGIMERIGCLMEVGGYLKTLLVILVSGEEVVEVVIGLVFLYLGGRMRGERLYIGFLTSILAFGGVIIVFLAMGSVGGVFAAALFQAEEVDIFQAIALFLWSGITMLLMVVPASLGEYHGLKREQNKEQIC